MSITELNQLIVAASNELQAARDREASDKETRRVSVAAAVSNLETLLGARGAEPGTGSIRAVRGFDEQTLADNPGTALALAFQALELVTENTLNMARIIATSN